MGNNMIGKEHPVAKLLIELRNACVSELLELVCNEHYPNLVVCKIREYGRKWEQESKKIEEYSVKPDGFVKYMKKELLSCDCPEDLKATLKYL